MVLRLKSVTSATTRVPVRYFVLGVSHVDEIVDSAKRVKFARALEIRTDTFAVFREPDGRLWIFLRATTRTGNLAAVEAASIDACSKDTPHI